MWAFMAACTRARRWERMGREEAQGAASPKAWHKAMVASTSPAKYAV